MSLATCVRVTTRNSAVWRHCPHCQALAPLAPDEDRCRSCLLSNTPRRYRPTGRRRSGRNRT